MRGEIIVLQLAQMRVSPDEGNIMLGGNGLQLNTAQEGNRETGGAIVSRSHHPQIAGSRKDARTTETVEEKFSRD